MSPTCSRCGFISTSSTLALCPRCLLTDDTESLPELPGLVIEGELGRGGMGRVFLARHVRLERLVAVKVLTPELADDADFLERFAREARALGRLNHAHIVTVHDFGTTANGNPYLVMEYMEGGTLGERIPLDVAKAFEVLTALVDALAEAHAAGIVHRDVKPENVLFDGAGRPKLADFGIARLLDPEGAMVTHPALVAGTLSYMAPEARAGAPVDPRLDVYALGVLVREMLTGRPEPTAAVLPAPFAELVPRLLAEVPADRPDAADLRSELARLDRAPRSGSSSLPPDEASFLRAVALSFAGATAVAIYAGVVSLSPRTLHADDALPLISFGTRALPDGRVFTQARFETWPTLAAGAAFAIALVSYGFIRRHWQRSGLELDLPDEPIEMSKRVLYLGAALAGLFALHSWIERGPFGVFGPYMPVLGGTLEFVLLYLVWFAVLEAVRRHRPLRREGRLWLGLVLALIPPSVSFLRTVLGT